MTGNEMREIVQRAIGCTRSEGNAVVDALVAAGCVPSDALTRAAEAHDEFVNECCEYLPEDWDDDVAAEEIVLRWLRKIDALGRDHYVIFTTDRWTIEHSLACRMSGNMSECEYHEAIAEATGDGPPDADMLGRWRITEVDSEGLPSLERVEAALARGVSATPEATT